MKQRFAIVALIAVAISAAPVLAQCQKTCQKAKTCTAKTHGKACSASKAEDTAKTEDAHAAHAKGAMCTSDVTCDGDVVRYEGIDLPRIGFKVEEKITCCMKSATEMSGGDKAKIKFVVADKTYDQLGDAQAARVKVLEKYYEDILTLKYAVGDECVACPNAAQELASKSGKPMRYRLASFDFEDKDAAEKAIEAARAAGEKVSISCEVDGKKFHCPTEASQAAKTNGKPVEYCVGDKKTECQTTAKTRLLEARITAALETLAKAIQS